MGTLSTLDMTGDTRIEWNSDNPDEVQAARETFERLTGKGFLAYVGTEEGRGNQIRKFDPEAEKIFLVPRLVGG